MFVFKIVFWGAVLPALVAGVVFAVAWRPWRQEASSADGRWGGAVAIGVAYLTGHVGTIGWPPMPPVESTQWLFYLVCAASAVGLLDSIGSGLGRWRWGCYLALIGSLIWLTLRALIGFSWTPGRALGWCTALGAGILPVWALVHSLAERTSGVLLSPSMLIVSGAAAAVFVLSGSALLGQLSIVVAAAVASGMMLSWWCPTAPLARGATPVWLMIMTGLCLNGYFYAEVRWLSALLLTASPVLAWVGRAHRVRRLPPWKAAIVTGSAVLLVVTPAIIIALIDFLSTPEYYDC